MGSIQYNFLADSLFFNDVAIENCFANETDARIEKELEDYRNYCINNFEQIIADIKQDKSALKVFSSVDSTPISLLKQTALYFNQYTVADPLFPYSEPKIIGQGDASKFFGYKESGLKRDEIARACKYLKLLTPMVVGNYVKIFPISYYHERREIPFYLPTNLFNDVLPTPILDFFKQNADVRTMGKMKGGGWAVYPGDLKIGRGISVEFDGAHMGSGMIFHLVQTKTEVIDEAERLVRFINFIPDTPPTKDEFDAWVIQSINSTARKYFNVVFQEMTISANVGAAYLSDNTFTSNLISKNFAVKDSIQSFTATQMLNVDLPFVKNIEVDRIMEIRSKEADVFTNFRLELEKQFRELRLVNDEKELKLRIDNVFHELKDVQEQKIESKLKELKNRLGRNAALAFGGLATGFQTGGFSLLATAIAIGNGYKDYSEYKKEIVDNPAYFLWKVKSDKGKQ